MARVPKRALITGISGQDGSYLAELLLEQGLRRARARAGRDGSPLRALGGDPGQADAPCRRPARRGLAGERRQGERPRRGLQPRGDVVGLAVVAAGRRHRRVHGRRRHPPARGDPGGLPGDALLPGLLLGDVRPRPGDAAERAARRSTRAAPTGSRRCTGTSSPSTTARASGSTPAPGSSSTTSRRAAGRHSSRVASATESPRSSWGSRMSCRSRTSMRAATGATRRSTSRRCG